LHRDDRTAAELVAEALKIANQSDVIVAALGESAEMSGKAVAERILKFHKHRKTSRIIKTGETCSVSFIHWVGL
jgi:beta-glucosidase